MIGSPWYKQFWPWFLFALPTVAVIASLFSLYIAVKHADEPIAEDYVQHGLTVLHKSNRNQRPAPTGTGAGGEGNHATEFPAR